MSMYSINQDLDVQSSSASSPIPVGINENVTCTSVAKKADKNGKSYLSFGFKDAKCNELSHNEFEINPEYVTPKDGETVDQAVERRVNNMLIRVKHICTKFIDESQFVVNGNTYDEFCDNLVNLMSNANLSNAIRLKVVYDYRDYNSLPNFAPFIEGQADNPSKLRLTSYDKLERTAEKVTAEAASSNEPDLPF